MVGFMCSNNTPVGLLGADHELDSILRDIDEAYIEGVDPIEDLLL